MIIVYHMIFFTFLKSFGCIFFGKKVTISAISNPALKIASPPTIYNVRMKVSETDICTEENSILVEQAGPSGALLELTNERLLFAKPSDSGVILKDKSTFVEDDILSDAYIWQIVKMSNGFKIMSGASCLQKQPNVSNGEYYLNHKPCIAGNMDQLFMIIPCADPTFPGNDMYSQMAKENEARSSLARGAYSSGSGYRSSTFGAAKYSYGSRLF
ncbi:hypothetical protein H311_02937 [Anncaliia algerae PRA109]|nr:hypothetical protein H311_02937 [Anncaliia algerae PRA109]